MKQHMNKAYKSHAIHPIPQPLPFQTPGEEIANAVLHGLGAGLSIAGLILLVLRANGRMGGAGGGAIAVAAYVLFTAAMICMFSASTLYHAITHERAKRTLRVLDHSAIYLLIAGTYTPFCLLPLRGALGWTFFGVEWALALCGAALFAVNGKLLKKAEVFVYIFMGWAIAFSAFRLVREIPPASLVFLFAGGAAYTLGTLWYGQKHRRGAHIIWHVFVLAGACCHWFSIWFIS
jgi:hemolysin III